MSAPPFIDSLDFAQNNQQLSGELLIADLLRLSDLLSSTQGVLSFTVQGRVDQLGVPLLTFTLSGCCQLRCQRCLGGMDYPIALESGVFLRTEAELDALEDDDEEFDSVLAEPRLDVQSLLEEELLLSLPISPRHEFCQATERHAVQEDVRHPFAALAKLKRN
jgi:uncharacterized protein